MRSGGRGCCGAKYTAEATSTQTTTFHNRKRRFRTVGRDISPGTYRNQSGDYCYWERLRGFGGTLSAIIANGLGDGPWIVTISATDKGFDSTRCGRWTLDLSPITASPSDPFGSGMYFVNKDIAPEIWQASRGNGFYSHDCGTWTRLN